MMDSRHHYETCLARNADCDADCINLDQSCRRQIPNLTGLNHVYPRLKTLRIRDPRRLKEGVAEALALPGPVLVDVWIDKAENVLPMVQPGKGLGEMIES